MRIDAGLQSGRVNSDSFAQEEFKASTVSRDEDDQVPRQRFRWRDLPFLLLGGIIALLMKPERSEKSS